MRLLLYVNLGGLKTNLFLGRWKNIIEGDGFKFFFGWGNFFCFFWGGAKQNLGWVSVFGSTRLSLKCSAWKGFINVASKKFQKKFKVKKKFCVRKKISLKVFVPKNCGLKNSFCLKNFGPKKFGLEKFRVKKNVGSEKYFGS